MDIVRTSQDDDLYPADLTRYLGDSAPATISSMGNRDMLREKPFALFCSRKCPGNLILQTYDLAQAWRESATPVIGGFHSPMERECLTILLRGKSPIIICPARSVESMRVPAEFKSPLEDGRLLIVSRFAESLRRPTVETAQLRNRLVAALADRIFVAYAQPGGKTDEFCREVIGWGKPLYTIECEVNADLIARGAKAVRPPDLR